MNEPFNRTFPADKNERYCWAAFPCELARTQSDIDKYANVWFDDEELAKQFARDFGESVGTRHDVYLGRSVGTLEEFEFRPGVAVVNTMSRSDQMKVIRVLAVRDAMSYTVPGHETCPGCVNCGRGQSDR